MASRLLERDGTRGEPREGCGVAVGRPDGEEARIALLGDVGERDLAGGDDVVPRLRAAPRAVPAWRQRALSGTGALETRITVPPPARKRSERVASLGEGAMPVVQHAPHVAVEHVVAREQLAGARQDGRGRRGGRSWRQASLRLQLARASYGLSRASQGDLRPDPAVSRSVFATARMTHTQGRAAPARLINSCHQGIAMLEQSFGAAQIAALLILLQRGLEEVYSARNTPRLIAEGGREAGRDYYPVVAITHLAWIAAIFLLIPATAAVIWPLAVLYLLLQVVRYWVIGTLGRYWTHRIITLPDAPVVRAGPYRYLRHPNYVVTIAETFLLAACLWRCGHRGDLRLRVERGALLQDHSGGRSAGRAAWGLRRAP